MIGPLSRRRFLGSLGAAAAAAAAPGLMSCAPPGRDRMNVLFLAVDDLNDWVSCLGGRAGVQTPNIDRLASRGVLFSNAHCTSPSCAPSRAAVMTGTPAATSGTYHNYQYWRDSPVLENAVTIPQYFRSLGYRATGGGKIFHALSWLDVVGYDGYNDPPSWDEYFPTEHRSMPEELRPLFWRESMTEDGRPPWYFSWGPVGPEEDMADSRVVDWAEEELLKEHDQPFFQAVGIYRPHIPWLVPQKYFDMYPLESIELPPVLENDLDDVPEGPKRWIRRQWHRWLLDNGQWKNAVQGYCASMSYADHQVGRILDALDRSPHAESTTIVLWSDHGMHLGEKEQWEKFTLWEESTRVPFIMSVPGLTPPGTVCRRPVSLLDIYPTLVDLAGGTPAPPLQGVSLKPWLKDPGLPSDRAVVTTWHRGNHAVRSERWRYIRYQTGLEELYDHEADPDEYFNLAAEPSLESVKEDLARWLPEFNSPYQPLPTSETQILLRLAERDGVLPGN